MVAHARGDDRRGLAPLFFPGSGQAGFTPLERFRAKWKPVRVKKTRQNKIREQVLIQSEPALGMRHVRRQFVLRQRHLAQAELHGNVVESAGPEAAIEMPQTGNDDPGNRGFNVRSCLIENEQVEARLSCNLDASIDDGRERILQLSPRAQRAMPVLQAQWQATAVAARSL